MQMNLTGFLHSKYARIFLQELWDLLLSAQENVGGIPTKFIEQKKEEIRQKKVVEGKRIQVKCGGLARGMDCYVCLVGYQYIQSNE